MMRSRVIASLRRCGESGQGTIFFAVMAPVLLLTVGLAVEGGQLHVEHQRLQAAADAAALVGAQDLPCAADGTGAACITAAETDACRYATLNGAGGCAPGASSGAAADVPPRSCSPYDHFDYGNAPTDSSCKQYPDGGQYNFIEVQLDKQIAVPIFETSFDLYAHAVAVRGIPSSRDAAVAVLDYHQAKALDYNLSTSCVLPLCLLSRLGLTSTGHVIVVGDQMSNSDDPTSITVEGDGTGSEVACAGKWLTYASESAPSGLTSYVDGTALEAPPQCYSAAGADNPVAFDANVPRVDDPYAASQPPTGNMSSTCLPCTQTGWAFTWTGLLGRAAGTWKRVDTLTFPLTSGNWEFFPGIYPNGLQLGGTVGNIYFNPGVYSVQGTLKITAGTVCIYGAPACDETTGNAIPAVTGVKCWNASFAQSLSILGLNVNSILSSVWYHFCSPYGMWDASALPHRSDDPTRPAASPVPTFIGGRPLNGVTFYMDSQSPGASGGTFDIETPSAAYLAAPNPCPGTGADTLLPIVSDDFPAGSSSSTSRYLYLPTSLAGQDALTFGNALISPSPLGALSSPADQLYPNVDYSIGEDGVCGATPGVGNVWSNEFGTISHLHFLVFQRDTAHGIQLTTDSQQYWWGLLYNPANYNSSSAARCAASCAVTITGSAQTNCTVQIAGVSGGGCTVMVSPVTTSGINTCELNLTCGPPTVLGQIVADNVTIGGDSTIEIYYRSRPPEGSGPGTALVE